MMKLIMTSATASLLLLIAVAPFCCYGQEPTLPRQRFVPWTEQTSEAMTAAQALGYTGTSDWDFPGTNNIEAIDYDTNVVADSNFVTNIATAMDITDVDTWDCYINHYENYDWDELALEGVQTDFIALGYTEDIWSAGSSTDADDKFWNELSVEEQEAAMNICYFENLWNEIPLSLWEEDDIPTLAPTVATTSGPPTVTPDDGTTPTPTISPITATPTTSSVPTNAPITFAPTSAPTDAPTTSLAPTDTPPPPFDRENDIDNVPLFRYMEWSEQTTDFQTTAANQLSYTSDTWNTPGTAAIELLSHNTIQATGNPDLVTAITDLGFTELPLQWDCYMNHFSDYSWDGLATVGVQTYLIMLDWTKENWEGSGSAPPASEFKTWSQLTLEERQAANAICYVQPLWDMLSLSEFDNGDPFGPTAAPTTAPPTAAPTFTPKKSLPGPDSTDKSSMAVKQVSIMTAANSLMALAVAAATLAVMF